MIVATCLGSVSGSIINSAQVLGGSVGERSLALKL